MKLQNLKWSYWQQLYKHLNLHNQAFWTNSKLICLTSELRSSRDWAKSSCSYHEGWLQYKAHLDIIYEIMQPTDDRFYLFCGGTEMFCILGIREGTDFSLFKVGFWSTLLVHAYILG